MMKPTLATGMQCSMRPPALRCTPSTAAHRVCHWRHLPAEGGWAHGEVMVITPWHSHVIGRYRLLQPLDKSVILSGIQLEGFTEEKIFGQHPPKELSIFIVLTNCITECFPEMCQM